MGKASSSKKIKRVQAAGATRTPGQRRELGYPAVIALIIVVGLVLTALAVMSRRDTQEVRPTVEDNWVAAYGTYICNEFIGNLPTVQEDAPVKLHADGLIHIDPTDESNSGENAVFGLYLTSAGIVVDATGALTLPDGTTYTNGDDCNGEPGRVALYQWPPQSGENTDPRIITNNIAGTRFTEDGQSYVLAFAPQGAEVPLPPSVSNLDNPDETEPEVVDAAETTTTVAGEGTDTTAPAGEPSETTLPEGETTTTVEG
ncbi:MAG: hypothetical protein ACR2OH_13820 [Microthrixaceae bacterium]